MPEIPSSRPDYDSNEIDRVREVLESGYTAEGPRARQLEENLSRYLDLSHTTVTSSGTTALHLMLEGLGIGDGDEVILPSYVCQAALNPIYHAGATPVLADVDPRTMCLSPDTVKSKITQDTALIILVHAFGYPVDETAFEELDVPVLHDICQAMGARRGGKHVGQSGVGAVGSLYATKQLSAGYGGFVSTTDEQLHEEILDLKQYDERDSFRVTYNYSLSDLNASVALAQLDKLEEHRRRRRAIAEQYDEVLDGIPAVTAPERPDGHACFRYVVQTEHADEFQRTMNQQDIEVKRPVHHPLHRDIGDTILPTSQRLHEEARLIPILPAMSSSDVEYVLDCLESSFVND